jgi:hypothetical protein
MASIISAGTTSGTALNMAGDTSGVLELATNGSTTAITIDTSQNVGIGTASPSSRLQVSSASDTNLSVTNGSNGNTVILRAGSTSVSVQTAQSIPMVFSTSATERMRITSGGDVCVNTTSNPTVSAAKLIIVGAVNTNAIVQQVPSSSGNFFFQSFYAASTEVGFIRSSNGTTINYSSASDYRLKENIAPMTGALDTVAKLKPVTYTWKQDGSDGQGFIAHELAEVVPDAVVGEKDAVETYTGEDGIEQTRPAYQGIDTSFLVATLTAAIQEQQTIINDLKARITALEGAA